jgi:hypothetical protein
MLKETRSHYTLCKKMYNTKFTISAGMRLPTFCRVIWKGPPSELERDICPFPPRSESRYGQQLSTAPQNVTALGRITLRKGKYSRFP